jgi:hypothetical protein
MAKKTITKEHPITTFRKANEARDVVVKSSMKKMQTGGTPFQQYMKIPKTVASDTTNIYSTPKKGSTLDNAFSATYGDDYQQKAVDYNTLGKFRGSNDAYTKPLKKGTSLKKTGGAVKKPLAKAQVGGTSMTPKKETLAEQNTRIKKEIAAREKRILTKEKKDERNSYSNSRANKVIGK